MPSENVYISDELKRLDQAMVELLYRRAKLLSSASSGSVISDSAISAANQSAANMLGHATTADSAPMDRLVSLWLDHGRSLAERLASPEVSIAYLGPIYSFSYLAAVKYFGLGANLTAVSTICAAFEEVQRGQSNFAVVPVENNTDGRIVDTLGMFAKSPVQICGEILLPIHHCLLGRCQRHEIVEVHSKVQPLSQCRNWLATHLPTAKLVEVSSTAEAAATAAASNNIAAIASREAGLHYGCDVIVENIEDNSQNVTRFAVIGEKLCQPTGDDKTSIMLQLSHRPGSLAETMIVFKEVGANLTWIESFPLPNRPNEYLFFIELEGHQQLDPVKSAIESLAKSSLRLDVLGSYPKGAPLA